MTLFKWHTQIDISSLINQYVDVVLFNELSKETLIFPGLEIVTVGKEKLTLLIVRPSIIEREIECLVTVFLELFCQNLSDTVESSIFVMHTTIGEKAYIVFRNWLKFLRR